MSEIICCNLYIGHEIFRIAIFSRKYVFFRKKYPSIQLFALLYFL